MISELKYIIFEAATVVDTGLIITSLEWNFNGSIIAVAGRKEKTSNPDEKSHEVKFFSPQGQVSDLLSKLCYFVLKSYYL